MTRIFSTEASKTRTLKMANIAKTIAAHFSKKIEAIELEGRKPRYANHQRMMTEMLQVVKFVIAQQIEEGFRLDLSDKTISLAIGVSDRRAKQLRLELKAAGIVWFPEWSRQRKLGDCPYWMIVKNLIKFPILEKRVTKPKTSQKYNQRWCKIYDQAKKDVFADLDLYDMRVTVKQFMVMVYQTVNLYIAQLGLTKEGLLR